ncbi:hypothetical protein Tco_0615096 [Tanacetum coccineum]
MMLFWFGSMLMTSSLVQLTKRSAKKFAKLLTNKFEISLMGELTYFLELQIKQSEKGISINQERYTKDLLKKYDINYASVKTPMLPPNNLGPDLNGKSANETQYRANLKESHLIVVKRIFRYLKGTPSLGLWYLKCSRFDLKGYSDSDYTGCNMDRKTTFGACQLLGSKLVCWSAKKQDPTTREKCHSTNTIAEADLGKSVLNDSVPQQQGTDEGTKNIFIDLNFLGTFSQDPTVHEKENTLEETLAKEPPVATKEDFAEASTTGVYVEDLANLMPQMNADNVTKEWDLDEDSPIDIDESDQENVDAGDANTYAIHNTLDLPSPRTNQVKDLTNQVLILQFQMLKLQSDKSKVEAEAALLRAQPKYPSAEQITQLLVNKLCQGVADLTERMTRIENQRLEASANVQAKLKVLDDIPPLLLKVSTTMDRIGVALSAAASFGGQSTGVAGYSLAKGEKTTTKASKLTIAQLFKKHNLKKAEQPKKTSPYPQQPPPSKPITSPFIDTSSAQSKGEPYKVDKGKGPMHVDRLTTSDESTESDSTSNISTGCPKGESKVIKQLFRLGHLSKEEFAQEQRLADKAKTTVDEDEKEIARKELRKDLGEDLV